MKLSEMEPGEKVYVPLARDVLAVLSRRVDGYAVYVGAVPGESHDNEWREIARHGSKQSEPMGRAIVETAFHGLEVDVPYAR